MPAHVARARARELAPWEGGGGASIVLEDLGADAPATVTRAEFGMCAGHGVRSPTSSKVQEAGPSHVEAFSVPRRHAGFVAGLPGIVEGASGIRNESLANGSRGGGSPETSPEVSIACCFDATNCCFDAVNCYAST